MRYTTCEQARVDAKIGLAAGRHLTGRAETGTPLSAEAAVRRYGPKRAQPEVRETWRVPRGTAVRKNPVLAGARGVKEITLPERLPPRNLLRVEPLPPN